MYHAKEHSSALDGCSIPFLAATGWQKSGRIAVYYRERQAALCRGNTIQPANLLAKRISVKSITGVLVLFLFLVMGNTAAQNKAISKKEFFTDDQLIEMTMVADFKKLINEKMKKDVERLRFLKKERDST